MKLKTIIGSLMLCVSMLGSGQSTVKKISKQDYDNLTKDGKISVYDVRTPGEFSQGYLKNAKNSNWLDGSFSKEIETIDPKKPVIVYCKMGGRSAKAAQALEQKGFTTIYELDGGYDKYMIESAAKIEGK